MAIKRDTLQVTLLLDGKQSINQLGKLEMEYADVRRTLKGLKKDHQDYQSLVSREKALQTEIRKTRQELGLQGMTLQQLIRHTKDLDRIRTNSTTRGTAEYKRLTAEIRQANQMIAAQKADVRQVTSIWQGFGKQLAQFGAMALGYLGFTYLTSQLNNLIRKMGELSDSLASVQKTTGLSAADVDYLNTRLKLLNTRTARKELLEMAKVAGKLNITSVQDVEGFVRAFDKINVALGEDLGNPEEVAKKLGKIIEAFDINKQYGIEESLLKVGSAINHLGKSSTASEGYIVEFTRRLAGVAPLARISLQDIMGLAAANDALGQTSEVSSTALSKLFLKMVNNRELFVKYTKDVNGNVLSLDQFSKLIETDFNEAFISLLRGVKDNSQGMIALSTTLQDLELDGGRIIGVMGTLANNIDVVSQQQRISNVEFEKGTSVLDEYAIMNETLGAKMEKMMKIFSAWFVNSKLVKGVETFVGWFLKLNEVKLSDTLRDEQAELNMLVIAIQNANDNMEVRKALITELQTKYPNFLGNIDAESVANETLAARLKDVNNQYLQKIIIQEEEEELTELAKDQIDLMKERIELEKKLAERQATNRGATVKRKGVMSDKDVYDKLDKEEIAEIEKRMAMLDEKIKEAEERKMQLMAAFNLDYFAPGKSKISVDEDVAGDPVGGGTDDQIKAYKAYLEKLKELRAEMDIFLLDSELQEVAKVEQKYEKLLNEAYGFYEAGVTGEEEFKQQVTGINQAMADELGVIFDERNEKYNEARKKLQDEIALEGLTDQESELVKVNNHYDNLIAQAVKYNLDTISLEEQRLMAIDAINDKYRNQSLQDNLKNYAASANNLANYSSTAANIFSSLGSLQSEMTAESIENTKRLANAQVLAANVAAMAAQYAASANAIEAGTNAGKATGPLAPFTTPAFIAGMLALVIGSYAQIRNNKRAAESSLADLSTKESSSKGKSFYHGGETGNTSMSIGDAYGPFTGYTHANELVVPSYIRQDPSVIDAEKVIKARMNGYSMSTTISGNFDDAAAMMMAAAEQMVVLFQTGIEAKISNSTNKELHERYEKFTGTRDRGKIG